MIARLENNASYVAAFVERLQLNRGYCGSYCRPFFPGREVEAPAGFSEQEGGAQALPASSGISPCSEKHFASPSCDSGAEPLQQSYTQMVQNEVDYGLFSQLVAGENLTSFILLSCSIKSHIDIFHSFGCILFRCQSSKIVTINTHKVFYVVLNRWYFIASGAFKNQMQPIDNSLYFGFLTRAYCYEVLRQTGIVGSYTFTKWPDKIHFGRNYKIMCLAARWCGLQCLMQSYYNSEIYFQFCDKSYSHRLSHGMSIILLLPTIVDCKVQSDENGGGARNGSKSLPVRVAQGRSIETLSISAHQVTSRNCYSNNSCKTRSCFPVPSHGHNSAPLGVHSTLCLIVEQTDKNQLISALFIKIFIPPLPLTGGVVSTFPEVSHD